MEKIKLHLTDKLKNNVRIIYKLHSMCFDDDDDVDDDVDVCMGGQEKQYSNISSIAVLWRLLSI